MAAIGSIKPYMPESESTTAYLERVQLYLSANNIAEERHVAVLLSVIGSQTYALLRNLVVPDKPGDTSFAELTRSLTAHFDPKPLMIAERFHSHRRVQTGGKSVAEYVAELKYQAAHCDFGERVEEALRDSLVCGLKNSNVQRKLLTEPWLTYAKAVEVVLGMEAAEKST